MKTCRVSGVRGICQCVRLEAGLAGSQATDSDRKLARLELSDSFFVSFSVSPSAVLYCGQVRTSP